MKRFLVLMLPLLIMMSACSKDSNNKENGGKGDGNGTEEPTDSKNTNLLFTVSVPAQARPNTAGTYALDDIDENNVSTINVLVFKDNAGTMELADWAKAVDGSIENVGGDVDKKKFRIIFSKLVKTQLITSLS